MKNITPETKGRVPEEQSASVATLTKVSKYRLNYQAQDKHHDDRLVRFCWRRASQGIMSSQRGRLPRWIAPVVVELTLRSGPEDHQSLRHFDWCRKGHLTMENSNKVSLEKVLHEGVGARTSECTKRL